jgi:hypothetical protein
MFGFGVAVLAGKGQQLGILSPAGHGPDAFVNVDRASLARVIGAQFAHHVSGQLVGGVFRRCWVFHGRDGLAVVF